MKKNIKRNQKQIKLKNNLVIAKLFFYFNKVAIQIKTILELSLNVVQLYCKEVNI